MSDACYSKVQLVELDGQRTVGGFRCSRELGHEGRHRAPTYIATSGEDPVPSNQVWEWDNAVEVKVPTCGATHELTHELIHTAGGLLSCRLPAGHPLWHFTGVCAWPEPIHEATVEFKPWPDDPTTGELIAEARKILNDLLEVLG